MSSFLWSLVRQLPLRPGRHPALTKADTGEIRRGAGEEKTPRRDVNDTPPRFQCNAGMVNRAYSHSVGTWVPTARLSTPPSQLRDTFELRKDCTKDPVQNQSLKDLSCRRAPRHVSKAQTPQARGVAISDVQHCQCAPRGFDKRNRKKSVGETSPVNASCGQQPTTSGSWDYR